MQKVVTGRPGLGDTTGMVGARMQSKLMLTSATVYNSALIESMMTLLSAQRHLSHRSQYNDALNLYECTDVASSRDELFMQTHALNHVHFRLMRVKTHDHA